MLPVFVGRMHKRQRIRHPRQSAIENRQSEIPCAYLTVMDRNPQAVEKALTNNS
jgi:hypothetical protein